MSNEHAQRYEVAKKAIDRVFMDASVDRATTKASLICLVEEIEIMLDSLRMSDE